MPVFRLSPLNPHHASWELSTIREEVWAGAVTDAEARSLVASKTVKAGRSAGVSPAPHMPTNPWEDSAASSCVREFSRNDVPIGTVVDVKGKTVAPD
jgi:hypothetical protein